LNVTVGPFAVQAGHISLLAAAVVASGIGYLVGRKNRVGIGDVLVDMALVAVLASRFVFVATWFDAFKNDPWTIFDIRDGGFTPVAGVCAAIGMAIWRARRSPQLRRPLSSGLIAGSVVWGAIAISGVTVNPGLTSFPTVELTDLSGKATNLSLLSSGRPVVVNLWATWCPPCRREMPVLAQAQQRYSNVVFVFVNQGEDPETVQRYLGSSPLKLDNVLIDASKALGHAIESSALPTSLFYDGNGHLVSTHIGALSEASLAAKLAQSQGI